MSRMGRRDRAHIEMLRHHMLESGGCAMGCPEWSMSHVAEMAADAIAEVIIGEIETEAERWDAKGQGAFASGVRGAAFAVRSEVVS